MLEQTTIQCLNLLNFVGFEDGVFHLRKVGIGFCRCVRTLIFFDKFVEAVLISSAFQISHKMSEGYFGKIFEGILQYHRLQLISKTYRS